jgi:dihydrofolate reductase
MERSRGIGQNGKIPWHLPADLARFKQLTMGHSVIMGKKTFESIGRALPGRRNIVLTRDPNYSALGCDVASSLEKAFAIAGDGEVFVIGGGEVYRAAMPYAKKVYLTVVDADLPADVYFPEIDAVVWRETGRVPGTVDEKNQYPHAFITLER